MIKSNLPKHQISGPNECIKLQQTVRTTIFYFFGYLYPKYLVLNRFPSAADVSSSFQSWSVHIEQSPLTGLSQNIRRIGVFWRSIFEKSFLKNESRVNLTLTIFSVSPCSEFLFSHSDHILILSRSFRRFGFMYFGLSEIQIWHHLR